MLFLRAYHGISVRLLQPWRKAARSSPGRSSPSSAAAWAAYAWCAIRHPPTRGGGSTIYSRHHLPDTFTMQVLVGHPMDTIKVRIQTMEVVPGKPPPYAGMVDCAKQIVAKEGVSLLS